MNGVRLEDLPPEARARVQAALDLPAKRKRTTQRHVGVREAKSRWICRGIAAAGCGETFTTYASMDRHMHATGHARFELDLGGNP